VGGQTKIKGDLPSLPITPARSSGLARSATRAFAVVLRVCARRGGGRGQEQHEYAVRSEAGPARVRFWPSARGRPRPGSYDIMDGVPGLPHMGVLGDSRLDHGDVFSQDQRVRG
jgi:hypothetical protein